MLLFAEWVLYVTQITSGLAYASAVMVAPMLAIGWWLVGRQSGDGSGRFWRAAKWWMAVMFMATVSLSVAEAARDHQPWGLAAVVIVTVAGILAYHHQTAKATGKGDWPTGQK